MDLTVMGNNIRSVRESLNLTRTDVEKISGVSTKHIGEIERGETNASITSITKLAQALNLTVSELIGEQNIKYKHSLIRLIDDIPPSIKSDILNLFLSAKQLNPKQLKAIIKLISSFKTQQ